jgi:hypothetical protein
MTNLNHDLFFKHLIKKSINALILYYEFGVDIDVQDSNGRSARALLKTLNDRELTELFIEVEDIA